MAYKFALSSNSGFDVPVMGITIGHQNERVIGRGAG